MNQSSLEREENEHPEERELTRREFVQETGRTIGAAAVGGVTAFESVLAGQARAEQDGADMGNDELFTLQQEGYAKLCALVESEGEGVDVLSEEPPIIRIPYAKIEEIFGKETATKARAGGKKILTCSDGRVVFTQEAIHRAKEAHAIPEEVPEDAMKMGYPGLGALLTQSERQLFYDKVQERDDVLIQAFHEDCGACNGDTGLAKHFAAELDENGLHAAMTSCGYSQNSTFPMTGHGHFHEELGFVISSSDNFAAERLPIARHMQLAAYLEPNDQTLNMHTEKLFGILMGHGWGPERSQKHPIVITVAGVAGDKDASADQMMKRIQPTWGKLQEKFPGTFKVVAFDVEK